MSESDIWGRACSCGDSGVNISSVSKEAGEQREGEQEVVKGGEGLCGHGKGFDFTLRVT